MEPIPTIENLKAVRWTVEHPPNVRETLQEVLVAASADLMVESLVKPYDPSRERNPHVATNPREFRKPAPDLRPRLVKIEVGTPLITNGYWWTSPNLKNDNQRTKTLDWEWREAWIAI